MMYCGIYASGLLPNFDNTDNHTIGIIRQTDTEKSA